MTYLHRGVIAYLKTKADLLSLLSDTNSIFIENAPLKKLKYVTVSSTVGESGNCIPSNEGVINITAIISRQVAGAPGLCLALASKIDGYVNKQEIALTDATYKVRLIYRTGDTELLFDENDKTYYVPLSYTYILDVS